MTSHDREALISWSAVAEPGDSDAGALVSALGPAAALGWVLRADGELAVAAGDLAAVHGPALAERAARAHERWMARMELADAPHEARASAVGARVVTRGEPGWPLAMTDLGDAQPFALYVRGEADLDVHWSRSVAIVGSRAATGYGAFVAAELAGSLSQQGWAIVSGGAYGIDAAAHRAALAAGGSTIAVMAGGVDRLYPAGNDDMLRRIIESSAVVSEVPPGFAPHRSRFLSRNRLIGAAGVTVIVEAAHRSGALSTARHAAELLRPVGAVPGPITVASSAGCHALIRDGLAVMVTGPDDVAELASSASEWMARDGVAAADVAREGAAGAGGGTAGARAVTGGIGARTLDFANPHERAVYDAAGRRGVPPERLAAVAGVELKAAIGALGSLAAKGLVVREEGMWRRAPATPPQGRGRQPRAR